MARMNKTTILFAFLIANLSVVLPICAQSGGTNREKMWRAPTDEEWQKPCLITFQRTWKDALAVAKKRRRPILVCVNMDGEIASEHYAGVRYRQKEIAKLYKPYVAVIASTYRHTPHDYDEDGHRVLCPRFGSVTCGEHIAIEPILFAKFMEGKRIAPRHICVELNGQESYDVYYAMDTKSVFQKIDDGMANRNLKPIVKGDRSLVEKVKSADVSDRNEVETAYKAGDKDLRRALLEAAKKWASKPPLELLRLAVNGFDEEMARKARQIIARTKNPQATDLISEALQSPMNAQEKKSLLAALDKLGSKSTKARRLAVVHKGLAAKSGSVKVEEWSKAMQGGAAYAATNDGVVTARLRGQNAAFAAKEPEPHLDLAEAFLTRAVETAEKDGTNRMERDALFADALSEADRAKNLGATGWRLNTIYTVSAYYSGKKNEAYKFAVLATQHVPADATSRQAMIVLGLFAEFRRHAISDAVRDQKKWPGEWLTELHAAYSILADHPFGEDSQVTMHYDFLVWLGARRQASGTLRKGLKRFPNSWALHSRFRTTMLRQRGITGLEKAYEAMLREKDTHLNLNWFAGYAYLVAAEFNRRRGASTAALKSYAKGMAHYEESMKKNPNNASTAKHYIAMAHGGRARVAYEGKKDKTALKEILAAFAISPDSAATLDGLNLSAVDTAKMLLARLKNKDKTISAKKLEKAMAALDPEMLKLPAYEGVGANGRQRSGNRRGNR